MSATASVGSAAASADAAPNRSPDFSRIDLKAFGDEVAALRAELVADLGEGDLQHLARMRRWGRACSLLGYAFAWLAPNPLSALLMGMGNVSRWANVAHPVLHRGYDAVPAVPQRFTSQRFAHGWRRWLDWPDWLLPAAWCHEHNELHHFHTGQAGDPDLVERNARILREARLPRVLKALLILLLMSTWKLSYYAPNTFWALKQWRLSRSGARGAQAAPSMADAPRLAYPGERLLLPLTTRGLEFYLRCVLPYAAFRFGLLPLLFLPLGLGAWAAVLINSLLAELIANVISFVIIAPNHTGDDLHRFPQPPRSKGEFYLQQVIGSVNYPGGSDIADFLQGHLNYQIEHHVWPDLPLLKYQQAAPRLKAICRRHGVPYLEQSVFKRFQKTWAVLMGDSTMPHTLTRASVPAAESASPIA
jgi:fatty acid desaturase